MDVFPTVRQAPVYEDEDGVWVRYVYELCGDIIRSLGFGSLEDFNREYPPVV